MGVMERMTHAQSMGEQAMDMGYEILCVLKDMRDQQGGTEHVQFSRRTVNIQADGAGVGAVTLPNRAGVDLELISFAGAGSQAGGVIAFYLGQSTDTTALFAVHDASALFGDTFGEGDLVPEGRDLTVALQGAPANALVTVNLSMKAKTRPAKPVEATWTEDT